MDGVLTRNARIDFYLRYILYRLFNPVHYFSCLLKVGAGRGLHVHVDCAHVFLWHESCLGCAHQCHQCNHCHKDTADTKSFVVEKKRYSCHVFLLKTKERGVEGIMEAVGESYLPSLLVFGARMQDEGAECRTQGHGIE